MAPTIRGKTQKDIGALFAEYACNPEDYSLDSLVGMVKEILTHPNVAIVNKQTIIYKCPKCNSFYDYQPQYKECVHCGNYLDAYIRQAE